MKQCLDRIATYLRVMHPGLIDVIVHFLRIPYCQHECPNGLRQPQVASNVSCDFLGVPHCLLTLYSLCQEHLTGRISSLFKEHQQCSQDIVAQAHALF